jgi:hypothetical protein
MPIKDGHIRSQSRHFWMASSSMGKGIMNLAPSRIAPTLPELSQR